MPQEEEIEVTFTPDGRIIVGACVACALGAKDDRCGSAVKEYIHAMVQAGKVTVIREPSDQ